MPKKNGRGAPLRMDVANNAAIANADATRSGWFWLAPGGGLHLFQRCQGYGKSSSSSGLGHAIGTRERRREERYASLPQRAIGDRLGSSKTDWNERVLFCFVSSFFGTFDVRCVSGFILVCDSGDDADLILQIRESDESQFVSLT